MQIQRSYPADTFNHQDKAILELARKMVFETSADGNLPPLNSNLEMGEVVAVIAGFLLANPDRTILVETPERVARVRFIEMQFQKWGFIAFMNLKNDLSPAATQSWAISVTPMVKKIEWHAESFLLIALYG